MDRKSPVNIDEIENLIQNAFALNYPDAVDFLRRYTANNSSDDQIIEVNTVVLKDQRIYASLNVFNVLNTVSSATMHTELMLRGTPCKAMAVNNYGCIKLVSYIHRPSCLLAFI